MKENELTSKLNEKSEFYVVAKPKLKISKMISTKITEENINVEILAETIGVKSKDILDVTSGKNYKIDLLLKIINELNIELFSFND